jgi:hypothetical protein
MDKGTIPIYLCKVAESYLRNNFEQVECRGCETLLTACFLLFSPEDDNSVTWRLKARIVESDRKLISYATSINRAPSRDNTRLGIQVTAELEAFPWQRVVRQTVSAVRKYRNLRGGVCYHGCLTVINRSSRKPVRRRVRVPPLWPWQSYEATKGKSQICDSKIWSRVPRDSNPRKTALTRSSSNGKRQTRPLVRESYSHQETSKCLTVIKWLLYSKTEPTYNNSVLLNTFL